MSADQQLPSRIVPPVEIPTPEPQPRKPQTLARITSVQFSGPLPPPALLKQYEEICPGYAERLITAFEAESAHRREMERKVLEAHVSRDNKQFAEARCGQICALIITLAAIGAGVYTALAGYEIAGSVIGVGGISGIVATFIVGRSRQGRADHTPEEQRKRPAGNNNPKSKSGSFKTSTAPLGSRFAFMAAT